MKSTDDGLGLAVFMLHETLFDWILLPFAELMAILIHRIRFHEKIMMRKPPELLLT